MADIPRFIVRQDGKYGFIDDQGKVVIDLVYDHAQDFSDGLARVWTQGKSRFIDTDGKAVFESEFDDADPFHEGRAKVSLKKPGGYVHGYVDKAGKLAIEPQYRWAEDFSEGLACVQVSDGKFGKDRGYIDWRALPRAPVARSQKTQVPPF